MKSMTGYGWGETSRGGCKVTVELSSVNRKQSEISINLPRELEVLEAQIRDEINRCVARGRVNVRVTLHAVEGKEAQRLHLNRPLARAYARELRKLAKELGLNGGVSLEALMRAPGVMQASDDVADAEDFWPPLRASLKKALTMLLQMRGREGQQLRKDLNKRIQHMRKALGKVKRRAPTVLQRFRAQLRERVKTAGLDPAQLDDERLHKEVVLFADRSDISEEIARLDSHFLQYDSYENSSEPVGRTLDFLAQEINREINTIGSKANDSQIAAEVVILKTELEKFREQAQNVE